MSEQDEPTHKKQKVDEDKSAASLPVGIKPLSHQVAGHKKEEPGKKPGMYSSRLPPYRSDNLTLAVNWIFCS